MSPKRKNSRNQRTAQTDTGQRPQRDAPPTPPPPPYLLQGEGQWEAALGAGNRPPGSGKAPQPDNPGNPGKMRSAPPAPPAPPSGRHEAPPRMMPLKRVEVLFNQDIHDLLTVALRTGNTCLDTAHTCPRPVATTSRAACSVPLQLPHRLLCWSKN